MKSIRVREIVIGFLRARIGVRVRRGGRGRMLRIRGMCVLFGWCWEGERTEGVDWRCCFERRGGREEGCEVGGMKGEGGMNKC